MNRKLFLYVFLLLASLLSGVLGPLVQPPVAFGAPPNTPTNSSPANMATGVSLTPTLTSSAFSDSDNHTFAASQWQIALSTSHSTNPDGSYASPLYNLTTGSVTSVVVPSGTLTYLTAYYWHVRYRDSNSEWSAYSTETSFTTLANQPPAQPTNVSPANGTTVSRTPTLQSSAFNDPGDTHDASQWQVALSTSHATNPDGSYLAPVYNSVTNSPNLTSTTVPSATLAYSTTYYWHVRHQDNNGAWSAYSAEWAFTTSANQSPNTPTNSSPANMATGVSLTPTLTSSAFSDPNAGDTHAASQWQVALSTNHATNPDGGYSAPVYNSGTDSMHLTTIVVPALAYSTTYYWHVRYQDNNGGWSAYSAEWAFTTLANQKPARPTNVSPNAEPVPITPTLTGSPFSDPGDTHTASQWQIRSVTGAGSSYSSPVFDSGTDNASLISIVIPSATLKYSTIYWWHVKYRDNNGTWSDYSAETWFVTSNNQVPGKPVNTSPADGATVSITPMLQSSAFNDAGDTHAASQWQITTTRGNYTTGFVFDSGTDNVNLTSLLVPAGILSYSTTFYWHVRHLDNNGGWSEYSAETSFTTLANQPPQTPTNVSPANLATVTSLTPTLQSSAFNDPGDTHAATRWQVTTVATNWDSSLVWDNVTSAPNLTSTVIPAGDLGYSMTYYWRVQYQDNTGAWSAWSSVTSFTTRPMGTGADFEASITALIVGQSVQFTDTSTGAIVSWAWDFDGDGVTDSTSQNPSHPYGAAGTYTVALTITDSADSSYTETKPGYITVFVLPVADFSASATAIALGQTVTFTSLSSGGVPPLTYAWDLDGDGDVDSSIPNPSHSYNETGAYTVSLKVTDARGNSTTERRAGYISVSNAIAPHTIPPEGGTIQTADGRIAILFPPGAVAEEPTLSIDELSPTEVAKAPDGYKMGSTCFAVEAVDAEGKTVAISSQWMTVTVRYSDEDVAAAGGNPENLVLAWYNSATGKWTVLDTTLSREDRSLCANTTHFSTWAVLAKKPSGGMASWIWIVLGIVAGLGVAILVGRAVTLERTDKARQEP